MSWYAVSVVISRYSSLYWGMTILMLSSKGHWQSLLDKSYMDRFDKTSTAVRRRSMTWCCSVPYSKTDTARYSNDRQWALPVQ